MIYNVIRSGPQRRLVVLYVVDDQPHRFPMVRPPAQLRADVAERRARLPPHPKN